MQTNYGKIMSTKNPNTTQGEKIPGKESLMVPDSDGCMVFAVDCWKAAERFLILGSENGSYYATEKELTKENAKAIETCLNENPKRLVDLIVDCTTGYPARAYKKNPAIFALALVCSSKIREVSRLGFRAVAKVCTIPTNLFMFLSFVKEFRGWGRGLREAVAHWYNSKTIDKLERMVIKYQKREGWSHGDVIRQSHPTPKTPAHSILYRNLVRPVEATIDSYREAGLNLIATIEELNKEILSKEGKFTPKFIKKVCSTIVENHLTHEMVLNDLKGIPEVWEALLQDMPYTAMLRNLGKMSSIELLKPFSSASKLVTGYLTNESLIKSARIHPFGILVALTTYVEGRGVKGNLSWTPNPAISGALDKAFYSAFKFVEPTNKNILVGLDVSGSMQRGAIQNTHIIPAVGAAAMCMTHLKQDPTSVHTVAFSDRITDISLTGMRLQECVKQTNSMFVGSTDLSLPFTYAIQNRLENVDAFVIYTDSEQNFVDSLQPVVALQQYRKEMKKPDVKLIVVGMVSNGFSIADPTDVNMLDVVGFDANAPAVISDFIRGKKAVIEESKEVEE